MILKKVLKNISRFYRSIRSCLSFSFSSIASFTLVELLIVIGILAVLTASAVVVLNPANLMRQSRDSTRMSDLATLNSTIALALTQNPSLFLGTSSIVYTSLYDTTTTCANLGLPPLLNGFKYNCITSSTSSSNIDGTGWLPISFSSIGVGSISKLPLDPKNTTSSALFYKYSAENGFFELSTGLESNKYAVSGVNDGGTDANAYEVGTKLTLIPGISTSLYTFTSHTFTPCGASGRNGPTLAACRSAYSTSWANTYLTMSTNGIQLWTVPETATYRIEAYGAAGGTASSYSFGYGGLGARIRGDFTLNSGDILKIVVGQGGGWGSWNGSGGGGSFVTTNANTPLIVAGGGGGGCYNNAGVAGTTASSGTYDFSNVFAGGTGGAGGTNSTSTYAASGAGFSGNGAGNYASFVPYSFLNNAVGGYDNLCGGYDGGFGGGGATYTCQTYGGGGGGGYSGGASGNWPNSGGGGGSYNSGSNQSNSAGVQSGSGQVIITKL